MARTTFRLLFVGMVCLALTLLAGCAPIVTGASAIPQPTAIPNPFYSAQTETAIAPTMIAFQTQAAIATATESAIHAVTATKAAEDQAATVVAFNLAIIQAEGTQQAAQQTAEAWYAYSTATSQAHDALQTAQAEAATQAAWAAQATETASARYAAETQVAFELQSTQAAQTQTAVDLQLAAAANDRSTQTAWPQTATPLAATEAAILRADQAAQQRAEWDQYVIPIQSILPSLLLGIIAILLVIGGILLYPRLVSLLKAVELRTRTYRTPDGEMQVALDPDQPVNWVLPNRAAGHALLNRNNDVSVSATPAGPEWQDRVTGRDQTIHLARAVASAQPQQRKQMQRMLAQQAPAPQLPPTVAANTPRIVVLDADNPDVSEVLATVEPELLEGKQS